MVIFFWLMFLMEAKPTLLTMFGNVNLIEGKLRWQSVRPFDVAIGRAHYHFPRVVFLVNSAHGTAAIDAGHALSDCHADWESGGHHVARVAGAARMRCGRGRGHAAHGTITHPLRNFQTAPQLFPV